MAHFIRLIAFEGTPGRVNVDNIFAYYPHRCEAEDCGYEPGEENLCPGKTSILYTNVKSTFVVRETPDKIDRLINPTGTA